MPKVKAPKFEPELSKCCKAEIRTSDDGYGNQKPFCNACLLNIAPEKQVKKETLEELDKNIDDVLSEDRPCHAGCKGDCYHRHVAFTSTSNTTDIPPYTLSKWHQWFRYAMFLVMGIMLTLAFFKLSYDIHTSGLGDILFIRK
jgi:hypothetical protein